MSDEAGHGRHGRDERASGEEATSNGDRGASPAVEQGGGQVRGAEIEAAPQASPADTGAILIELAALRRRIEALEAAAGARSPQSSTELEVGPSAPALDAPAGRPQAAPVPPPPPRPEQFVRVQGAASTGADTSIAPVAPVAPGEPVVPDAPIGAGAWGEPRRPSGDAPPHAQFGVGGFDGPHAAAPLDSGPSPAPPPPSPQPGRSLEMLVGGRLAAWIGALIVVLGAAFFFQYAHAHGWLAAVTPLWRCLLAAAFGALLLAAGEVALRRVSRAAAVGLFSAGLGTIYLTVLVAYRRFELVGDLGAFALFVVTALAGLGLTVRSRSLVVGVLSLLAGYAAPLMTDGGTAPAVTLPLYLTMLLGILLGLSGVMPRPFRVLRHIGLPVHGFIGFLWLVHSGTPAALGTVFAVAWWGMVFAEALMAALRGQSRRSNATIVIAAAGWLATVLAVGLNGLAVDAGWAGIVLALVAVASVSLVTTYDGGGDPRDKGDDRFAALRRAPRSAMALFGLATWLQGGVLLATAAALQFADIGVTAAWLALGLAAVEFGRRLRAGAPVLFGTSVLLVTAAKMVSLDLLSPGLRTVFLEMPQIGLAVTPWSLLALGGSLVLGAAAWRAPRVSDPGDELVSRLPRALFLQLAVTLCAVATSFSLAAFEAMAAGPLVSALWLLVACVLLATRSLSPHLRPLELGGAALIAAMVRWLGSDAWEAVDGSAMRPWLNPHLFLAIPMAAAALWFDRILSRERPAARPTSGPPSTTFIASVRDLVPALPVVSVLAAISIEVLRGVEQAGGYGSVHAVQVLWWVIIWSLGGLLIARLGRMRAQATVLRLGLVITLMAALGWLTLGSFADRAIDGVAAVTPVFNLQVLAGATAAAAALVAARLAVAREPRLRLEARGLVLLALLAFLCMGSYEVERIVPPMDRIDSVIPFAASAVSLWWGLFGTALVVIGFVRRISFVRYAGLALLGVTVVKFLLLDLRAADNIWRVVALVAVGLLLLAVGVLYVRFGARVVEGGREVGER